VSFGKTKLDFRKLWKKEKRTALFLFLGAIGFVVMIAMGILLLIWEGYAALR